MNPGVITATLILLVGVGDDFYSRKFHNWLFIACSVAALVVALFTQQSFAFGLAIAGFTAGIVIFLPLVLLKIIGAGDMKLMAAFGIVAGWNAVLQVAVYSLFWGAAFGVLQIVIKGQLPQLLRNLAAMTVNRGQPATELHRIPYTAALFVGWLTHLYLQGAL